MTPPDRPNPYKREPQVRMTFSLPPDVIAWVRAEAKRYAVPASRVVARAIELRRDAGW